MLLFSVSFGTAHSHQGYMSAFVTTLPILDIVPVLELFIRPIRRVKDGILLSFQDC